jgi:signal transduction histidine kinase/ABC-type phosphate/phosphonate transport system substrate-binding protein
MKAHDKPSVAEKRPWKNRLVWLCLLSALAVFSMAPAVSASGKEVKIAVLSPRGDAEALRTWRATALYLAKTIPGYSFSIVPYDFRTITPAAQHGAFDFVVVNPSIYIELEALCGITRIATLKGLGAGSTATLFGGVVFCRKDRSDIRNLTDIKHKTFMATEKNSFGGWRMAWREFQAVGIDPYLDFRKLEFAGTLDGVVYAVRDGKADAGTVRTGIIESMAREGKIALEDFKILNPQSHENFTLAHSTRLYPEWPFARMRHTDDDLAQKVTIALLSMKPRDEAAKAAKIVGWTTPHDYSDIHELFKELKIGPYKEYGKITLSMVLDKYRYSIVAGLVIVVSLMFFTVFTLRLNDKLNRSNVALEKTYQELKTAQSQMLQNDKMASIGQLAAGVAHEINNPAGFILSNLNSLRKYVERVNEYLAFEGEALAELPTAETEPLKEKKNNLKIEYVLKDMGNIIDESQEGMERIKNIVKDLKNFSHVDEAEVKLTDVNAGIESTINIAWNELKYKAVVKREFADLQPLLCNPGQINQVVLNLLVNAAHAIEKQGEITIRTSSDQESIYVSIADNGPGIPQDIQGRLFEPFFTTKEVGKGTGLGLSIAYDIVKKHNGDISVESEEGKGACFTVRLPLQPA